MTNLEHYLTLHPEITLSTKYKGLGVEKYPYATSWVHFQWQCTLVRHPQQMTIDYKSGTAHMMARKGKELVKLGSGVWFNVDDKGIYLRVTSRITGKVAKYYDFMESITDATIIVPHAESRNLPAQYPHLDKCIIVPTAPTLSNVLLSLILDARGVYPISKFEDWCEEYEYDSDSRRAERVFSLCQSQTADLLRLLGREELEKLLDMELEDDYLENKE